MMRPTPRLFGILCLFATCLAGGRVVAQAEQEGIVFMDREHAPTIVDEDDLNALAARVRPAIIPLRIVQDLGPGYRPSRLVSEGIAVWIETPTGERLLVTALAPLAQATEVSAWSGGEWVVVTKVHGTPIFDLTELEAEGLEEAAYAFPVTSSSDATLMTLAPVTETEAGELQFGRFGRRPGGNWSFYQRSLLDVHNGYPLFDTSGVLVAITSIPVPDRRRGVLAIGSAQLLEWIAAWPQVDGDSPVGWSPRVETEEVSTESGQNVFR